MIKADDQLIKTKHQQGDSLAPLIRTVVVGTKEAIKGYSLKQWGLIRTQKVFKIFFSFCPFLLGAFDVALQNKMYTQKTDFQSCNYILFPQIL